MNREKAPNLSTPEIPVNKVEAAAEKLATRQETSRAETSPAQKSERAEEIRRSVEQHATASEDVRISSEKTDKELEPQYSNKQLRKHEFQTTMSQIRSKLSPTEKTLSKVIHQDTVEKISDVGAKTIGRPSGILVGSLAALLGSIFVLYYSNSSGYEIRYSMFYLLFIGGFIIGVVFEFLYKLVVPKTRR